MENSLRKDMTLRWGQLTQDRSSWVEHWREISEYLLPRSGRFLLTDVNRGRKRHNRILDGTGTRALRVNSAGMMSGASSPARPWFRLTTSDPNLDESAEVKRWLNDVTRLMQMVFSKSNTYRMLHTMYEELAAFGTASAVMVPDFQNVIHFHPQTIGGYAIAEDYMGRVDTFYREESMTVAQVVQEFGWENCSQTVRNLYDKKNYGALVPILHGIEPRRSREHGKRDAKNMPWRSVYIEQGAEGDQLLRESGYKDFPVLAPRWMTTPGDVYGNGPGMEALGDLKQLQHEQLRKAEGIDYKVRPPVLLPTGAKGQENNLIPGGHLFADVVSGNAGVRSAFEVNIDLRDLREDIQDVRGRINQSFFVDMFLMLAGESGGNMTATEANIRNEERMLMLGPVLERLHNEIFDPLIERTFARLVETRVLPPPPQEMQGRELNVEFVSVLAQAQRAVATSNVDRYVANLGMISQYKPDVLDKFDSDKWADAYADMLGVDPEMVIPGDQVALIRKSRAEAQQAAQQSALMNQGADTAQKLGSINTAQPNALTDLTRGLTGYT